MKRSVHYPDTMLLLFAREPVRGQVKTRLQGALGEEGTLRLHEDLIRHSARMVSQSGLCPWRFCVAGDPVHPLFLSLSDGLAPLRQTGSDLGERMALAVDQALRDSRHVILLGADCASVDAAALGQALAALHDGRNAVLGPAEDGGYVLLGLDDPRWLDFSDMPWGTSAVLDLTRQRLRQSGTDWCELAPGWDVDRAADLSKLARLRDWLGDAPPPVLTPGNHVASASPRDSA
ncbi:MAG: TIGR04282 family arsenosugar biosynthesis glycosyltransferase [Pseudomonadota bacterium]